MEQQIGGSPPKRGYGGNSPTGKVAWQSQIEEESKISEKVGKGEKLRQAFLLRC